MFAELVVADPELAWFATGGGSEIEFVVGDVLIRAGADADEGQPTVTKRRVLQPILTAADSAGVPNDAICARYSGQIENPV